MMLTTPAVDVVTILVAARPARHLRPVAQPRPPAAGVRRRPAGRRARRRNRNGRPGPRARARHRRRQSGAVGAERAAPRSRARARSIMSSRSTAISTRRRATRTSCLPPALAAVAWTLRSRAVCVLGAQRGEIFGAGRSHGRRPSGSIGKSSASSAGGCSSRVRFAGWPFARRAGCGPSESSTSLLRIGPYRLTLAKLRQSPHGMDLGPLEPGRFAGRIATPDRKADLAPDDFVREARAQLFADADRETTDELVLIGRRQLRSNNSWMHNSRRLVKGPPRCTLLVHPDDASVAASGRWRSGPARIGGGHDRRPGRSDRRDAAPASSACRTAGVTIARAPAWASRASTRVRASTT